MPDEQFKNNRILIVDDQDSNLVLLETLLKMQGYSNYKSLNDSRQVVQTVQEWDPDLILLDLMMPYMDGFSVMNALQPLIQPDDYLPILILTADASAEAKRRALAGGALDFLTKPIDTTEAILRIGNLLQTRYLHRQLKNQNTLLEEKVRERTAQLNQRAEDLTLINTLHVAFNQGMDAQEIVILLCRELRRIYKSTVTMTAFPDSNRKYLRPQPIDLPSRLSSVIEKLIGGSISALDLKIPITGNGIVAQTLRTGESKIINNADDIKAFMGDFTDDLLLKKFISPAYELLKIRSMMLIPLVSGKDTLGFFEMARERPFTEIELERVESITGPLADAVERRQAGIEIARRLQNMQALQKIEQAIAGSFDLNLTLAIIVEEARTQLNADAVAILLSDPYTQILKFAAGTGFRSKGIEHSRLRFGQGHGGLVASERRTISVANLLDDGAQFVRAPLLADEGFVAYFGAPLIAKGQMMGVLEIFHRASFSPDQTFLDFLEVLAKQTAIAVDNARLFSNLQRSNTDLFNAYDTTIEGWSHALDLRDKETEGHTLRVTEMTMDLARAAGMTEEELIHVRRGALLHDIGKMGVPDHILLKPDKLTDEEWGAMRKHPAFAFELLSPIAYLKPALDIPYCHHEKWDGSGYPRGLKGEQIPLAGRLFAVVDVWDALRSDRPYRKGWSEEKVAEHIKAGSGSHFDPKVVELFLRVVNEGKSAG